MSKNEKTLLSPKLRFSEFRESDDWEPLTLNELLFETKKRNRDLKYNRQEVLSVSGEYGCVNQIEFMGRSYAGASVKDYHIVETGDIVYTKSPLKKNPFGIIKENKGKPGIVSTLYAVYRTTKKADPSYLDQYFTRDYNLNSYLQPIVRKGPKNDMKVNNYEVLRGKIPVPSLIEQQKIADCLSSIDDLISAEDEKLSLLQDHKKGLMQKLFPAEDGIMPELRFPEFLKNKNIIFKNGNIIFEPISNKEHNSDLPILAITQENGAIPRDQINYKVIATPKSIESYKVVEIGDFIISLRSFQGGIEYSMFRGICSPAYIILRKKTNLVDTYYKYYFKSAKFIKDLNKNIEGIRDGKMVSFGQFSSLLLPKPENPEQQKIADCLSSIEELITAQSEKIEALKSHKTGLMQNLFPSIEEVSE